MLHTVEFFDRSAYPASAIANRLAVGLAQGHGTAAIAATRHLAALRAALAEVDRHVADGALVLIDADEIYRSVAAQPAQRDHVLMAQLVRPIEALVDRYGRASVYGELVDVLCRAGDREGAISLERWWNAHLEQLPIELHCGYSIDSFSDLASLDAFRRVCSEHDCCAPRATEHELRTHLVLLQRVTSALCGAASYHDIGRVVTGELALAVGATRCVLAIEGDLITVRGATTPDEPQALAAALDRLPAQWTRRPPPELAWLGGTLTAVIPLEISCERRGTLVLGFRSAGDLAGEERLLVEDLARQLGIAIDRAFSLELARRERARAQTANAAKDRFLSMLGHELRNPLSPILTATQLMRLRAPDSLVRERTSIERSVAHVMRIVDDLLDVVKLEQGSITLLRSPAELTEVLAHALELVGSAIEERSHRFHMAVPPGTWIDVDRTRMAQVFAKLIGNAAKYTRAGGTIEVTARDLGDHVEVAVIDNGSGIPTGLLPHIFDLFAHGQGTDRGGLGVGLPLARAIVELHGGTIAASSGPGAGSRLTVTLARWTPPTIREKDTKRMATLGGDGRRVLVVDDNEDAAWLLAEALRIAGHEVAVCHDGLAALELARDYNPEIAFLDIGLPGIDGYALCSQLRALPCVPKIVAVTGYGQAADRDRARQAGFDMHFVKPVSLRDVHQAIASFARS